MKKIISCYQYFLQVFQDLRAELFIQEVSKELFHGPSDFIQHFGVKKKFASYQEKAFWIILYYLCKIPWVTSCSIYSGDILELKEKNKNRKNGGGGGIRTHGTLLTYTRFPSVLLKPLGHPSRMWLIGQDKELG